jgi:hypothetical protein
MNCTVFGRIICIVQSPTILLQPNNETAYDCVPASNSDHMDLLTQHDNIFESCGSYAVNISMLVFWVVKPCGRVHTY